MTTNLYLTRTPASIPMPTAKQSADTIFADYATVYATYTAPCLLSDTSGNANTVNAGPSTEPGSAHYNHMGTWISAPLPAQTISGTITLQIGCMETDTSHNANPRIKVYKWLANNTKGSDLLLATSAVECSDAGLHTHATQTFFTTEAITETVFANGDKIAIEIETYDNNTLTSVKSNLLYFNGQAGEYLSYITFSDTILFSIPGTVTDTIPTNNYQVSVFDTSMNLLGIVDDYEYFQWVRNWYTPDTWVLYINRYKQNASTILSGRSMDASGNWSFGGFIGVNTGAGFRIGMIERIELPLDERGKVSEQYRISGRGIEGILGTRIAFYGTAAATGYDAQNVAAETAMRHYVDVNCITTDAARVITGLTLYPIDLERGLVVDYQARFQGIDEVLHAICRESGLCYKLYWTGTGLNFLFTVEEGTDLSSTVTLSTGFGNIEEFMFLNSILDMKNLLYVGDGVDAAARTVQDVYTLVSEPSGWARRELFVDARDLTTAAQLTQRGNELMADLGESVTLEVKYLETNSFVLGKDFDLGDTVTVVYPSIVTLVSRVISITEEISPENGLKRTLGIGKAYPDLRSIIKNMKRATAAEVRK